MFGDNPYSTPDPYAACLYPPLPPVSAAAPPPQPQPQPKPQQPQPPQPSDKTKTKNKDDDDGGPRYTLKTIRHHGRTLKMLCQEFNGPCPLLALCNVLLLRGEAAIRGGPTVRGAQLLEVVANTVLARNPHVPERDLQAVLRLLPTLQSGLDVNVFFTRGTRGFEETDAMKLFELARVPLVHGWLVDPADAELHAALDGLSYNSAQVAAVDDAVPPARRALVAAWLADAPQLTPYGLRALQREMPRLAPPFADADERLGVLFRNNHFAVVCHRGGALYTLVTDEGFADRTAVWELLQETTGDTRFYRDDFTPYGTRTLPLATLQTVPSAAAAAPVPAVPAVPAVPVPVTTSYEQGPYGAGSAPAVSPRTAREMEDEALARQLAASEAARGRQTAEQEDRDFALALRMQEEEEAAAAQRRQGTVPRHNRRNSSSRSSNKEQKEKKAKKKKDDDCTVQ